MKPKKLTPESKKLKIELSYDNSGFHQKVTGNGFSYIEILGHLAKLTYYFQKELTQRDTIPKSKSKKLLK